MQRKIAIDLMGNDNSPTKLLDACIELEKEMNAKFIFIGTSEVESYAKSKNAFFIRAKSVITLHDNPLFAIRKKVDSSMALGISLLKEDKIDAFISAGNSGALMSLCKMKLNLLKGVKRPALCVFFPTKNKVISILDVGANISFKSNFYLQNAILGVALQKALKSKKNFFPKVGLLNIGGEAKKGTIELKKAYNLLSSEDQSKRFEFIGNIEPRDVFEKDLDVLVTDGFTGNIFLKTSEGLANYTLQILNQCSSNACLDAFFDDFKKYLQYENYPGALLLGVDKVVVKCHSYSSVSAFVNAIKGAFEYTKNNLISNISKNI